MALHAAVTRRYPTVVRFLLDHGADVNARNQVGATPLALLSPKNPVETLAGATPAAAADSGTEAAADPAAAQIAALLRTMRATQ